jgi:hypothetical protein
VAHRQTRIPFLPLLLVVALAAARPPIAVGQTFGSDFHSVTVQVNPITVMQMSAGSVTLTITGADAVAGQELMTASDASTQLLWGTNSSLRKVTASTALAAPVFTVNLVALNPTFGTAAPEFPLSTTAQDVLLDIGRSSGRCTLRYTASVLASQGTGTELHIITFTVVAQ